MVMEWESEEELRKGLELIFGIGELYLEVGRLGSLEDRKVCSCRVLGWMCVYMMREEVTVWLFCCWRGWMSWISQLERTSFFWFSSELDYSS